MPGMRARFGTLAAGFVVAAGSSVSLGQLTPVVVFERADASDILLSEKDAGLVRAMEMLPARIAELPDQTDGMVPFDAIEYADLAMQGLAAKWRFSIVYNADEPNAGFFGYGAIASLESKERGFARDMEELVSMLLEEQGGMTVEPSDRFDSMSQVFTPAGPVEFGRAMAGRNEAFQIMTGPIDRPEAAFAGLPRAPRGVTPQLRGMIDFRQTGPLIDAVGMFAGENEEQVEFVIEQLEDYGLIGEDAMQVSMMYGSTGDTTVGEVRLGDARPYARKLGLPTSPLDESALRAIPADASLAVMSSIDLTMIEDLLDDMAEMGAPIDDMLFELEQETGIDLRRDVLRALGGSTGFYMSDRTGGNGLLSSVFLIEVQDYDRFSETHARLVEMANGFVEEAVEFGDAPPIIEGIGLKSWEHDGLELMSVRFDGLPVPFEPTYALTEDWLIFAMTPQAAIAALQQANGDGDDGMTWVLESVDAPVYGVQYLDTETMARGGYQWVSLVGSAIANGVRNDDRDPGLVVPLYHELLDDAIPMTEIWTWDGDDFVIRTRSDGSLLVQGAAIAGTLEKFAPLLAAAGFGAFTASQEAEMMDFGGVEPSSLLTLAVRSLTPDATEVAAAAFLAAESEFGSRE